LSEAEHLLLLSRDLGFLSAASVDPLLAQTDRIARLLSSLRDAIRRNC